MATAPPKSAVHPVQTEHAEPQYQGLRMSVDEFFQLPEDGYTYELIDGIAVMSPSPTPEHQDLTAEIVGQLYVYLRQRPVGKMWPEIDVHLGRRSDGQELVYKPEVVFIRTERASRLRRCLSAAPDLVVEVISRGSRRRDTETKRDDYERFGVGEYWIMDPEQKSMTFLRLQDGRFVEVAPEGDVFHSSAVPGFELDLVRIRALFPET